MRAAISVLREIGARRVCEVGCGLLANTEHILRVFPQVVLVDRPAQYPRIKDKLSQLAREYPSLKFLDSEAFTRVKLGLDGGIVINVLHVLPTRRQRVACLAATSRNLRRAGLAFVDVPRAETYYRDMVKSALEWNDGFVMDRGGYYTFYKNMSFEEVRDCCTKAGLEVVGRIDLDHRISIVVRKP